MFYTRVEESLEGIWEEQVIQDKKNEIFELLKQLNLPNESTSLLYERILEGFQLSMGRGLARGYSNAI